MQYLIDVMIQVLMFFYQIGGHNYGLAIVWLTVAVNMALYPLTLTSTQQMKSMQKIQPRLKELQKKYKDEPQKLQKEMMDLYKGEGVNPFGGCLPVLLKIPFFLALFWAIQSKEFLAIMQGNLNANQFLWVSNLSKADPLFILPVLIGITTYLMQKTMPEMGDQAKTMIVVMPVFIVIISFNFPAGVQIYWIISNLIGALQQYYIMRKAK